MKKRIFCFLGLLLVLSPASCVDREPDKQAPDTGWCTAISRTAFRDVLDIAENLSEKFTPIEANRAQSRLIQVARETRSPISTAAAMRMALRHCNGKSDPNIHVCDVHELTGKRRSSVAIVSSGESRIVNTAKTVIAAFCHS